MVQITDLKVKYESRVNLFQRIFFFSIGLFPLIAPYELIYKVRWTSYFNLFFLFALLISIGAICVAALFIFFSLASYSLRVVVDKKARLVRVIKLSLFKLPVKRVQRISFSEIEVLKIKKFDWSEGPDTYKIIAHLGNGLEEITIGECEDLAKAEAILKLVKTWLK